MTDKRLPISGGCLCGTVRYESTEPANTGGILPLHDVVRKAAVVFTR